MTNQFVYSQNVEPLRSKKALMDAIVSLTLQKEKEHKKKLFLSILQEQRNKSLQEINPLKKAG